MFKNFLITDLEFAAPTNAVIFDPNMHLLRVLRVPELISPEAVECKRKRKINLVDSAYFRQVYWETGNDSLKKTVLTIDFNWEWWETRVLDADKGEFGELVDSGRR